VLSLLAMTAVVLVLLLSPLVSLLFVLSKAAAAVTVAAVTGIGMRFKQLCKARLASAIRSASGGVMAMDKADRDDIEDDCGDDEK